MVATGVIVCYTVGMSKDETLAEITKLDAKIEIEDNRYDRTDKHFLENKNRRILLVSAELVIFMYLFSDLQNMVPNELYGQIFFAAGVMFAIASLVFSFMHCRPIAWPEPIGPIEIEKINSAHTELEWKSVIYDDYRACNVECKKILSNLAKTLKYSLFCFVISVIILVIIKYF